MSLFNFRRAGSSSASNAASASQTESVEVIRRRAKHRLIGSVVLVLIGVIGFPLLFDTQPRPVGIDIPIEIPGKNTVKPLTPPANASNAPNAAGSGKAGAADQKVAAANSLGEREEVLAEKPAAAQAASAPSATKSEAKPESAGDAKSAAKPELKPEPKREAKAELKPEPKPEAKPEPKPETRSASKQPATSDDGARARALLEGTKQASATTSSDAPAASGSDGRLIVQVGAFADAAKAREARAKLEKAGLKTYTQVAETPDGKRTRVRVGPFATRADAEKAASKIKTLDLPAAILTL